MAAVAERCSAASARLGEPLAGSAPEAERWLVLEQPGPWGRDALAESDVPPDVAAELAARAAAHGVKVHLVQRSPQRAPDGPRACFLASTQRGQAWVERHELTRAADVLALDLATLGAGRPTDPAARWERPLYLVCTHGRRDACCAEFGRPLARALAAHRSEDTWQCAHLGGHRFAPTMLALPHGLCYGRVPAAGARALAAAYERGRVIPELLRGRAGEPWAVQVADVRVREQLGLRGIDDLALLEHALDGPDAATVTFGAPGERRVVVDVTRAPTGLPRPTSCGKAELADPPVPVAEIRA
jgi:hypothetical protein